MNFENALNELEILVKKLETGQLSLEESLACFEKGVALSRQCQQSLTEAQQKIQILQQTNEGDPTLVPFS